MNEWTQCPLRGLAWLERLINQCSVQMQQHQMVRQVAFSALHPIRIDKWINPKLKNPRPQ